MRENTLRSVTIGVLGAFLLSIVPAPVMARSVDDVRRDRAASAENRPMKKAKGGTIRVGGDPMDPGRYVREVAMGLNPVVYKLPRDTYAEVGARNARWSGKLPAGTEVVPRWVSAQKVWLASYVKECGNTIENRIVVDLPPPPDPEPKVVKEEVVRRVEVPVDRVVVQEVIREVPVDRVVVQEVVREVPVEKVINREVSISPPLQPVNGACGTSSGKLLQTLPLDGLCAAGFIGGVYEIGAGWSWSCLGVNGGMPANCGATRQVVYQEQVKEEPLSQKEEQKCFIPAAEAFVGAGGTTFGGATLLAGAINPWVAGGILAAGVITSIHSIFSEGDSRCKAVGGIVGGVGGGLAAGYAIRKHNQHEDRKRIKEPDKPAPKPPVPPPDDKPPVKPNPPPAPPPVVVKPNPPPAPPPVVVKPNPPPAPPPYAPAPQYPVAPPPYAPAPQYPVAPPPYAPAPAPQPYYAAQPAPAPQQYYAAQPAPAPPLQGGGYNPQPGIPSGIAVPRSTLSSGSYGASSVPYGSGSRSYFANPAPAPAPVPSSGGYRNPSRLPGY